MLHAIYDSLRFEVIEPPILTDPLNHSLFGRNLIKIGSFTSLPFHLGQCGGDRWLVGDIELASIETGVVFPTAPTATKPSTVACQRHVVVIIRCSQIIPVAKFLRRLMVFGPHFRAQPALGIKVVNSLRAQGRNVCRSGPPLGVVRMLIGNFIPSFY